jgi:hypothetical protein
LGNVGTNNFLILVFEEARQACPIGISAWLPVFGVVLKSRRSEGMELAPSD